ncbi:O-antigen ligase family protein [Micrococcus sp. 2A]|uniref:O-antigen ligase family protein n=1 Tax=Micrococcus sp. 2A TaxID=3142261 RepID=UPI0031BA6043
MQGVNSVALDAFRYVFAILIVILSHGGHRRISPLPALATFSLLTVNAIFLVKGTYGLQLDLFKPIVGLVSILLAFLISFRPWTFQPMLAGLTVGGLASAVDILLQYFGMPYIGMENTFGLRYSGLSFSSTNTAPLLGLASLAVIQGAPLKGACKNWLLRSVLVCILVSGMWISGGRGGFIAFSAALILMAITRMPPIATVVMLAMAGIYALTAISFSSALDALLRVEERANAGGGTPDITSGRVEFNAVTWNAFADNPFFGPPISELDLLQPHTPVLLLAVQAGIIGLAAALLVLTLVIYRLFCPSRRVGDKTLIRSYAVVILIVSALEPNGFFVGIGKTVILMIVLSGNLGLHQRASTLPQAKSSPPMTVAHKIRR